MAGFNNTPPASEFRVPTSWGRTRSPKNLTGTQGGAIVALSNTNNLKGITATNEGYATENQRFLHVLIEETNDGGNTDAEVTTIYGYCHAFRRWFPLPQSFDPHGANSAPTFASVEPSNVATTPTNHDPDDGGRAYRVYEIVGIDRVAFVNAEAARVNIFAACSTF